MQSAPTIVKQSSLDMMAVLREAAEKRERVLQEEERALARAVALQQQSRAPRTKFGCAVWHCGGSKVYDPGMDPERRKFDAFALKLPGASLPVSVKARPAAFGDVRPATLGMDVGVVGFYWPGRDEIWDTMCGAGFLSNFWDLGPGGLELEAKCNPGVQKRFRNAEAAFQALKFWKLADEFAELSGEEAFRKKKQLAGGEDRTYAGFGSNWRGMRAVLQAKFRRGSRIAEALVATGDAFLLQHNAATGRDTVWSDNCDGEGTNWLGLQLMLLRDMLSGNQVWTEHLSGLVDRESGKPLSKEARAEWQRTVRASGSALMDAVMRYKEGTCQAGGGGRQSDWL